MELDVYETLVVSAKFVKMVDDRLSVRLYDANDGSDVNQKLGIPLVEEVYISYMESPRLFWIPLKSTSESISEIQDQLSSKGNFFHVISRSYQSHCLWTVDDVDSPVLDVIYAVNHPEYGTCYRAKLTLIGTDHAVAHFIDYGDSASIPLSDIHTCPESVRDTPPMVIKCGMKLNVPDEFHWMSGSVRVLKAAAEEKETLEAVFCEEVDGMKLIRSLKTEKQNLVEFIQQHILWCMLLVSRV
jgi:Tudor domain